jgi:DNA-directed RNA polymerase specialized sigma24 family protein
MERRRGAVAEWLGRGLQSLVHRFDSGPRLSPARRAPLWNSSILRGHKPTMEDRTDHELWRRAAAGDPEAFGLLYERHARAIYNYLFRRCGDWSVAEDLTSVVFLEAFRRRADATVAEGKVLAWLYGVATNVVRNQRRSLRRYLGGPEAGSTARAGARGRRSGRRSGRRPTADALGSRRARAAPRERQGRARPLRVVPAELRGRRRGAGDSRRDGSLAAFASTGASDGTHRTRRT